MNLIQKRTSPLDRRALLSRLGAAATMLVCTPAAPSILKGAGDIRKVKLINKRTDEWVDTVFWIEGSYIPEAMAAISHILRDWREDEVKSFSPATIDIISGMSRRMECDEAIEVISGYRSAKTNAMLRSRNRGVARNSYHMRAMAVDLTLKSRTVAQMSLAARSLSAGGVGTYTRSNFVHVDSGPVRTWGR